uniref:Flavonoid prenyltransferase n=1 Tax=Maclura tricuspidata TaxID=210328 RepID=A0A0B4ZWX8_9ROSA|nr:flavonoid prenyltransferase [Maclura tricuspidata]
MAFSISHSSLRLSPIAPHQRFIRASSHDNNSVLSIKNKIKSPNFPSKSSTDKLIFPVGLYGENQFSKSLSYGKDRRNNIRASFEAQPADSKTTLAKVSRFGSTCYKFLRPYAMSHTVASAIGLFARVLVDNPQFLKWSVVLKAFPGLIAMILATAYYIGINQIYDADIDRVNKPYLPIPSGELSLKQAWFLVISDLLAGLLILRLMNADLITTSLYCAGLFLGTFYSAPPLRFKESSFQTSIVNPLMAGILHNIGVLYASTVSLGLPFNLSSPPVVFIVIFITLYFIVITNLKDLTDIEGDIKHNIRTLPAIFGPRKTTFFFAGILLATYVGSMAAGICMPQAFRPYVMVPAHAILGALTFFKVRKLDKANYSMEESADFYQFLWKILCLEFVIFPFI